MQTPDIMPGTQSASIWEGNTVQWEEQKEFRHSFKCGSVTQKLCTTRQSTGILSGPTLPLIVMGTMISYIYKLIPGIAER